MYIQLVVSYEGRHAGRRVEFKYMPIDEGRVEERVVSRPRARQARGNGAVKAGLTVIVRALFCSLRANIYLGPSLDCPIDQDFDNPRPTGVANFPWV